jgi:hypothetical protein
MSIQKFHAEITSSKETSALFRAFRQLNLRVNAEDLPGRWNLWDGTVE